MAALLYGAAIMGGCDQVRFQPPELLVPTAEEAATFYTNIKAIESVELSGNVVVIHVEQPSSQLRQGGSLWAQVGPYIYLLSPGSRELLVAYSGVAAVRVITQTERGEEIARAMLLREEMNDYKWQRSLNLLGLALKEGSANPTRLSDLVRWGEQNTEFNYNPAYVPRWQ